MQDYREVIEKHIRESIKTKNTLLGSDRISEIEKLGRIMGEAVKNGKKLLFCGNGGSAADAQHLAAELVIRLRGEYKRPGIPALALTVDPSIMTAGGNDIGFDNVFARATEAYGSEGDVLIGISTSGNSENVIRAVAKAKEKGMLSIGLLGKDGGKLKESCDYSLIVPSPVTAYVQESHIMIGHLWCQMIEEIAYPR